MDERALRFLVRFHPQPCSDSETSELIKILEENPFFVCREDIGCFELIGEMLDEAKTQRVGYCERLRHMFADIIILLGRYCLNAPQRAASTDEVIVIGEPDLQSMLGNYFDDTDVFLSPEQIARELHITRRHFSRLMQQYYGMPYADKVNEIRCEYAKELLSMSELPPQRDLAARRLFLAAVFQPGIQTVDRHDADRIPFVQSQGIADSDLVISDFRRDQLSRRL